MQTYEISDNWYIQLYDIPDTNLESPEVHFTYLYYIEFMYTS